MRGAIVAVALIGVGCHSESETAVGTVGAGAANAAEAKAKPADGDVAQAGDVKEGDAKCDEGSGLTKTVREISEGTPPRDPVLPLGEGIAVSATIPPGDIIIEHECSHSMQPFGTGYWSSTETVVLAAGTFSILRDRG